MIGKIKQSIQKGYHDMKEIVHVQGLKKSFGKCTALQDVSFTVNAGEVLGFIGPNGAGKSTTIRILLGSIQRDAGIAKIFDRDVWKEKEEIHRQLSYVPGDVSLWGNLTGGEIIDLLMKLHGGGDNKKRDMLIQRFELDTKKKAKTYSKGNRQKVGLIAALAVDSELYIFDEPTSGLDPLMEIVFQQEVEKLKQAGKAVILSSHILSEVDKLADKVSIIRQGKIVESGSLEALRHLTRTRVTMITKEDASVLSRLPGVFDFSQEKERVTFSAEEKEINVILASASKLPMERFEAVPPTLEDLFMTHYEE